MSAPERHNDDAQHQYCPIDQWTCLQCFKLVSASRPPVFNADNCSCVEFGTSAIDAAQAPQPPVYEPQVYEVQYDSSIPTYQHNIAQSYASSSISVPCPEGPEREVPNANITNNYLPLSPDTGFNEIEHRSSSSLRSDMSYQMRRFLTEQELNGSGYEGDASGTRFLPQDIHIQYQSSRKVRRSSDRSKPSYKSLPSSGSEPLSIESWGAVNPVAETGTWISGEGDRYLRGGYPMYLSGMSESTFEEGFM